MTGLNEFLAERYRETRAREVSKRRSIPSVFDGHEVEIRYSPEEDDVVLVDGHPYPAAEYWATATEPAPDPAVLADLDAKEALLVLHAPDSWNGASAHVGCKECGQGYEVHDWGPKYPCATVRTLALPYASHPDYREEWKP